MSSLIENEDNGNSTSPLAISSSQIKTIVNAFTMLTDVTNKDPSQLFEHPDEIETLIKASEDPSVSLLLRRQSLNFINNHLIYLNGSATIKRIVQAYVKVISSENTAPPLLFAVLNGFKSLCELPEEKRPQEYVIRGVIDVVMQVIIDIEGFTSEIRIEALQTLNEIGKICFQPLIIKLFHWLSREREEDDMTQIQKERDFAVKKLMELFRQPRYIPFWTDEMQKNALQCLSAVFGTLSSQEFKCLTRAAFQLPCTKKTGGIDILEAYISQMSPICNSDRSLEGFCFLGAMVASNNVHHRSVDNLIKEGLFDSFPSSLTSPFFQSQAIFIASKLADSFIINQMDLIPKVIELIGRFLAGVSDNTFPEQASIFETLLCTLVELGLNVPNKFQESIKENPLFPLKIKEFLRLSEEINNKLSYAVTKVLLCGRRNRLYADWTQCFKNTVKLCQIISTSTLPNIYLLPSAIGFNPLPVVKYATNSKKNISTGKRESHLKNEKRNSSNDYSMNSQYPARKNQKT